MAVLADKQPARSASVDPRISAAESAQTAAAERNAQVRAEAKNALETLSRDARATLTHTRSRAEATELLRTLAAANDCLWSIEQQETHTRFATLVSIHESMATLRLSTSTDELIEAAPGELIRSCGFTRAMISRVRGSRWVPEVLVIIPDLDPDEAAFQRFVAEEEIPLAHMVLETDLVRRRMPILITDPVTNPRAYQPIVEVARSTSYTAAPIMPTGRVIGFLHADRFGQEFSVSCQDRDNLWTFAEHFGLLYERQILVDRIDRQRSDLHELLTRAIGAIDEICDAEIELARGSVTQVDATATATRPRTPLESLLSVREREVLELMASGATNNEIADALVLSEGTIKSHVKRILRKLHVENRAGAVARYIALVQRFGP
jgi:DNA-binding CsgD family transcriptional regulator